MEEDADADAPPHHGAIEIPVEAEDPPAPQPEIIAVEVNDAAVEIFLMDEQALQFAEVEAQRIFFGTEKLYLLNPSWKTPFHSCVNTLLASIPDALEEVCYRSTLALFLLPASVGDDPATIEMSPALVDSPA